MPSISFQVIYTKRKSISLQVDEDGQVSVRAPQRTPIAKIREIVRDHQGWINKKLKKVTQKKSYKKKFKENEQFLFLGEKYLLKYQSINTKASPDKKTLFIKFLEIKIYLNSILDSRF